ncbi:MAG TPA: MFS transporter [Nitrososphaerales archaeon]|nr:MFS transporter [Nitrososphaerales archaeon]HUK75302.1 MFS transporter [Nitrososphaerales archaeon]
MAESQSLLKDSDFMKFWVGQSVSEFGSQFSPLAIGAIAVLTLGATSLQLGILSFLNTIAFLTLGLLVGVWTDRHRRRRIMILADFGRFLVLFSIPISAIFFHVTMNLLYAVTLLAGVLTCFFEIAYQAYVPSLVEKFKIVDANSKLETTRSLANSAGPTAAGFVIRLVTAPMAVLGDTLGYLTSSLSLLWIKRPESVDKGTPRRSTWHEIREGLDLVWKDARLRAIAATTAFANFFSTAYGAIAYKYLFDNLQMSTIAVGAAAGIGSIGGVIGALLASRFIRSIGLGRTIVLGSLCGGLFMVSIYFAVPSDAFLVVLVAQFLTLFGILLYNVPQVSYRQALIPKELQGRLNATMRTIVWGVMPIGGLVGGIVGQVIGVHATIGLMTLLSAFPFLFILFSPVVRVRDFPE